jgi:hypothetical protein
MLLKTETRCHVRREGEEESRVSLRRAGARRLARLSRRLGRSQVTYVCAAAILPFGVYATPSVRERSLMVHFRSTRTVALHDWSKTNMRG